MPLAVRAVVGWQDAAVDVAVGDAIAVRYISGTWTINVAGHWFDADGYPGYYPHDTQGACAQADLPDEQNGALIGRIGDGPPFLIGSLRSLTADRAGTLQMRMNDADACLSDNGGSVAVVITLDSSATASPPAPATEVSGAAVAPTPTSPVAVASAVPPATPVSEGAPTVPRSPSGPVPSDTASSVAPASAVSTPPTRLPNTGGGDRLARLRAIAWLLMVAGLSALLVGRSRGARRSA
ncbi:MAG: hypothetical protein ABI780_11165 [Ardenticatenales bacterium]